MTRLLAATSLGLLLAGPAVADVTITATSATTGAASSTAKTVTHIKGLKLTTHMETSTSWFRRATW